MSSASIDRQLLFAILAFQNAFLSREKFLIAANEWVQDKSIAFDRLLVERGFLGQAEFDLLQSLVTKHVEMHGGRAAKSLGAVSSLEGLDRDLRRLNDDDINGSLMQIGTERPQVDEFATREFTSSAATRGGPRFRILRPHARGGLGVVHVALDEELHREVALKEIRSQVADNPEIRKRFVLEAEVTGSLEHPGIVPVYGLGQHADGRPFYAMRFVRGDSLRDAIEQFYARDAISTGAHGWRNMGDRALQFRNLLGRFMDVCQAIDFAHTRGVLHRDIKPGNIMLGAHGETLVVDWGLAKSLRGDREDTDLPSPLIPALAGDVTPTVQGSAIGTPAFMSPEQAEGRIESMGPASDVYSLGATLYCVLTGKPPWGDVDPAEILSSVVAGRLPPPSAVAVNVPPPLEAICLRAMARSAADRYQSAGELAEEIERWLADEPVAAYAEKAHERLARWLRRNISRVYVAAAAVLLFSGLAIAFSTMRAAEERAADANQFASALDRFLCDDLGKALIEAVPQSTTPFLGSALSQAAGRLLDAMPERPELRGRLHVSFGELLLNSGELKAARRQFEAAQKTFSDAEISGDAAWKARNGIAIVEWREGNAAGLQMVEKLRREVLPQASPEQRKWIDLELASALKNANRDVAYDKRMESIEKATELYQAHVPRDDEMPNSVSLNLVEMLVEAALTRRGAAAEAELQPGDRSAASAPALRAQSEQDLLAASAMLMKLERRLTGSTEEVLLAEVSSELAKSLHRIGKWQGADDAYARACVRLSEQLGNQHWRTEETTYSWMVLLHKSTAGIDTADMNRRRQRGVAFFLSRFVRSNENHATKIEQNAIGIMGQWNRSTTDSRLLREWLSQDRKVRDALILHQQCLEWSMFWLRQVPVDAA